jgi:type VI secretion system protein ImpH
MAAQPSESLKILEKNILEESSEYEFFQAYRLLESVNNSYPVSARRPARKIEVRPELTLSYAETDISEIKTLEKQRGYEIISQLPGLYGVASPLPDFYNEELLDNEWDELNAPREFLDIIHKQLFPKLYQAWRLYKLNLNTLEKSNDSYWNLLYSLMGDPNTKNEEIKKLKLRYFSLFTNKERSTAGLKIIISDFLDIDNLEIKEFQQQTVTISDNLRCKIGQQNHKLGEAHIGSKIKNKSLKVKAIANDISQYQYELITTDRNKLARLKTLLREFLIKPLQIELKFNVLLENSDLRLGQSWNQLGITSALGIPSKNTKSITLNLLD